MLWGSWYHHKTNSPQKWSYFSTDFKDDCGLFLDINYLLNVDILRLKNSCWHQLLLTLFALFDWFWRLFTIFHTFMMYFDTFLTLIFWDIWFISGRFLCISLTFGQYFGAISWFWQILTKLCIVTLWNQTDTWKTFLKRYHHFPPLKKAHSVLFRTHLRQIWASFYWPVLGLEKVKKKSASFIGSSSALRFFDHHPL